MAQQEEPLYDFPEPAQPSQKKLLGHQRTRGSLRSISVLDRLLLTVPVWLQLSINPATALHILRREPCGALVTSVVLLQTFLVRKSRTSQRNVLCVRLADDSVPSFVQQFGIKEEKPSKTLCLETSAVSFPDLPRLISFYCVSRDVLPFPLELPEAIARATSHKELESISHMGIEFWSSHLNVRGPREKTTKPQTIEEKKPDAVPSAPPASTPQTVPATQSDSAALPDSDNQPNATPDQEPTTQQTHPNPTLFQEFCPLTTRSPRELDCGSGLGALCFVNPLFLQNQNPLSRRRMFKHSLKVRISTESSTLLSPPLAPPPPPPLIPKKRKCKAQKGKQTSEDGQNTSCEAQVLPEKQSQNQTEPGPGEVLEDNTIANLPTGSELIPDDSDYMAPPSVVNVSRSPSLSPYMSPSVFPMTRPVLFPKISPSRSPQDSPGASPSLSPYQSPSLSPRVPFSLSPYNSPSLSPSCSPNQSPSPSPMPPLSPSPFNTASFSHLTEQASSTYDIPSRPGQRTAEREAKRPRAPVEEDGGLKDVDNEREEEENGLALQMSAASLKDAESCSSGEAADSTSPTQVNGTSLEGTNWN